MNFSELGSGISHIRWWPMVAAVALHNLPRIPQAIRWAYLLRPAKVRPLLLLHATLVGVLASGILPICPVDLVRGVVAGKRTGISLPRVLTSLAMERTADGLALALLAWITVRDLALPQAVDQALLGLVVLLAVMTLTGLTLTVRQARLHARVCRLQPRSRLGVFSKRVSIEVLDGAKAARGWTMPVCFSVGGVMLFAQVASMWLMLHAYNLPLSLMQAAAIYGIVTVGTLLPTAPSSIGSWQFFCVLGLSVFGVAGSDAAGFSLVAFAMFTLPSLLLGVIALVASPVSWAGVTRREAGPAGGASQGTSIEPPGRLPETHPALPLLLLPPPSVAEE